MNVPLALSIDPPNPTVVAGTETHAFLKLENDTSVLASLRLLVDGDLAAWIVPTPATIDVPPNGEATAALVLQPPADAKPTPYLVTLHALDQATGSELAQLSFALTVQAAPNLAAPVAAAAAATVVAAAVAPTPSASVPFAAPALLLTLNQTAQTDPNSAEYEIQVGNPTAVAATVELHATDETNRLALVIDPPQVILPGQGQAQSTLRVTANAPLSGSETQLVHTITVQAIADEGAQAAQASVIFVQTKTSDLTSKLPLILAALGIGLLILALLILLRDRNSGGGTTNPTVIPLPVTAIPTQAPIVITAVPLPTSDGQPTNAAPNATVPVEPPTPVVATAEPLPAMPVPGNPSDGTFTITEAVVSVQPEASDQCPATLLFTAQVTANAAGTVQYQWEFSNGENPPPARFEFREAGSSIAQTNLRLTESSEGWGRIQFTDPPFAPSNQASFVVNCAPAPAPEVPATAAP